MGCQSDSTCHPGSLGGLGLGWEGVLGIGTHPWLPVTCVTSAAGPDCGPKDSFCCRTHSQAGMHVSVSEGGVSMGEG